MVYSSEFSRPSTYYSGISRSRSSSLSRYSSPVRSEYVTSSRASTPLASYGTPTHRTLLQETGSSSYDNRRSSLSSTNSSSRKSSFSSESSVPTFRAHFPETDNLCRRASFSSLSTSPSTRRSSFSRNSPTATKKHIQFKEEEKEIDTTSSFMTKERTLNLESVQEINRKRDINNPMDSFDDSSDGMGKLSVRERYPSASSDACRKRQARAAYLSILDDTGIHINSRNTTL